MIEMLAEQQKVGVLVKKPAPEMTNEEKYPQMPAHLYRTNSHITFLFAVAAHKRSKVLRLVGWIYCRNYLAGVKRPEHLGTKGVVGDFSINRDGLLNRYVSCYARNAPPLQKKKKKRNVLDELVRYGWWFVSTQSRSRLPWPEHQGRKLGFSKVHTVSGMLWTYLR